MTIPSAMQTALMNAVNNVIGGLVTPSVFPSVNIANMNLAGYEAYVFTLVLRAIRRAGGVIELRSIRYPSSAPSTFVVRSNRGKLVGTRSTTDFGYARCRLNRTSFEVHIRITWQGSSGLDQEMDISMLRSTYAGRLRSNAGGKQNPGPKGLLCAVECKFYNIQVDRDLAQAWVGVLDDFRPSQPMISRFLCSRYDQDVATYCNNVPFWRPTYYGNLLPNTPVEALFIAELAQEMANTIP